MEELDLLESVAATYRSDRPSISEAMKSFSSVLAATGAAAGAFPTAFALSTPNVLTCARIVLRLTNGMVLQPPMEWAEVHPQGEESASARIDTITHYKACHLLALQCQQTDSAKITKLLGRNFLQATGCWEDGGALAAAAAAELSQSVPAETVSAFLKGWATVIRYFFSP